MARVAVIQQAPVFLDRAATLARAVDALREAAAAGADLVVFPEAFVPGYPAWSWKLRPGADMGLAERLHAQLRAQAVSLAGDDLRPLREAADAGAGLVVFPEAFVPGYPAWIWKLRPGTDMGLAERLHAGLRAQAVSLAGEVLRPLRDAAKEHRVTVVCGINEIDSDFSRGTLYNTVVRDRA